MLDRCWTWCSWCPYAIFIISFFSSSCTVYRRWCTSRNRKCSIKPAFFITLRKHKTDLRGNHSRYSLFEFVPQATILHFSIRLGPIRVLRRRAHRCTQQPGAFITQTAGIRKRLQVLVMTTTPRPRTTCITVYQCGGSGQSACYSSETHART